MAKEEEYESLSSEAAIKEAQENGGEVVFPTEYELQLDIDSEESLKVFEDNFKTLQQHLSVKHWKQRSSRSPGKRHITVEMSQPLQSNMERILLQACLGSDLKRELLSYARVLKRDPHPTLFIEGGKKPVKEDPFKLSMVKLKPFYALKVGDEGTDYVGEAGKILAVGNYDSLKKYDTTGACDSLDPDENQEMVAVETESGDRLLYVYGSDGFGVYEKSEAAS